jgi:hypothetical protein
LLIYIHHLTGFHEGTQTSNLVRLLKSSSTSGIEFNYQWQSVDGVRKLNFLLSRANIDYFPDSAPAYHIALARNYIHRHLLEYAKTVDPKFAKISIKRFGGSLNMEVSGELAGIVNEITETLGQSGIQLFNDKLLCFI